MTNANGAVQIETRVKHEFSISFQLVADEQSINVGTLVIAETNPNVEGRSHLPHSGNIHQKTKIGSISDLVVFRRYHAFSLILAQGLRFFPPPLREQLTLTA